MNIEENEQFDAIETNDMLNRQTRHVQHRLLPLQVNWQEENSEQFRYFIENNEQYVKKDLTLCSNVL